jgi:hypothetical protein
VLSHETNVQVPTSWSLRDFSWLMAPPGKSAKLSAATAVKFVYRRAK